MMRNAQRRSSEHTSGAIRRPTLYQLSFLRKRDPLAKELIADLGLRLFWVILDGRQAFQKRDEGSLASVRSRYSEISGEEGQPVSIDQYLREGQTVEGRWLARVAVADIIEQSLKKSAILINRETILRYMRSRGRQAYLTPGLPADVHRKLEILRGDVRFLYLKCIEGGIDLSGTSFAAPLVLKDFTP